VGVTVVGGAIVGAGGLLSDEEALKEKRGTCHDLM